VPGPGIYTPRNDISPEGRYILSRNVSAGKRTFMDGRRTSFTDLQARRSFSIMLVIQLLALAVIDLLLILVITITQKSEQCACPKAK